MRRGFLVLILFAALSALIFSQSGRSPFVGRWDFNMPSGGAAWLGITEKNGALDVWYQPSGGNVYRVKDAKANGSHLTLAISQPQDDRPGVTWDLDASGDKLTGTQKRGQRTT